jgi:hypothetical protein
MDGISLAASIIAVIQIATAVTTQAYKYGQCVKNAKEDIEKISGRLEDVSNTLNKLKDLADRATQSGKSLDNWPTLVSLASNGGPLTKCREAMTSTLNELAPVDGWAKQRLERGLWPLKKKKVQKCLDDIEDQKKVFIEALSVEHM